jgi:competence ComEA-like helix-hairpin-helix protein
MPSGPPENETGGSVLSLGSLALGLAIVVFAVSLILWLLAPQRGAPVALLTPVPSPIPTETPLPPKIEGMININLANTDELRSLPGIGPALANAILTFRNENGPFQNIEQIQNVPGIGPGLFENIREFITID